MIKWKIRLFLQKFRKYANFFNAKFGSQNVIFDARICMRVVIFTYTRPCPFDVP